MLRIYYQNLDRGTVWKKIFAINPEKFHYQLSMEKTSLINTLNIITSVQSFQDFIDELAGEYVDRNRTKRKDIEDFQSLLEVTTVTEAAHENEIKTLKQL